MEKEKEYKVRFLQDNFALGVKIGDEALLNERDYTSYTNAGVAIGIQEFATQIAEAEKPKRGRPYAR